MAFKLVPQYQSSGKGNMALSRVFFLVKNSLEFELKSVRPDSQVRLIHLEATVQDQKFVFSNISLCSNKNKPPEELNRMGVNDECRIIAGGGFNGMRSLHHHR